MNPKYFQTARGLGGPAVSFHGGVFIPEMRTASKDSCRLYDPSSLLEALGVPKLRVRCEKGPTMFVKAMCYGETQSTLKTLCSADGIKEVLIMHGKAVIRSILAQGRVSTALLCLPSSIGESAEGREDDPADDMESGSDTIGSGSKNIWSGSENIGTAGHPSGGFLAHLVTRHTKLQSEHTKLGNDFTKLQTTYTKLQGEHEEKKQRVECLVDKNRAMQGDLLQTGLMGFRGWNGSLTHDQLLAKGALPTKRVLANDKKGAFIFEKENKHVYRAAKLYTEYHKLTDLEDMEVIDIALMVMRAVVSGCLRPTHWLWEFIASQLQFFTVKDYRGRRCSIFSSRVAEFWFEFETRFGGRAYEFLVGKGWAGVGRNVICAQHARLQESLGLRYLAGGIGVDETDYRISTVEQALNAFELSTQLCMAQMNDARDFEYTWGDPRLTVQFTHWLPECESNLVALPAQLTVYAVGAEKRVTTKRREIETRAIAFEAGTLLTAPSSQRPAAVLAAYESDAVKTNNLCTAVEKILTECANWQLKLAQPPDVTDNPLDLLPSTWLLLQHKDELVSLCRNALEYFLAARLHLLPRAKKLQLWTFANSQRLKSQIVFACFVEAPNHQQNTAILRVLLEEFQKRSIPVISVLCDGASHSLATRGLDQPKFINAIWRAELDAVVKEGRKKAEIVECLKEEAHEYILQSRAQQWDGMPYGIGTRFVPHLPAGLETLLRNYRSEGAPFFATLLETLHVFGRIDLVGIPELRNLLEIVEIWALTQQE
ncbi:uncharacterized protein EV422DRAFT_509609 [Fimicolochytrium jonesii]|uniref:uncharacterized protein n=1 Tax=Fimicolochytrium jonesii TaxID=1396493 RepID=UPI0022FECAE7|nr:uncharacterized protein EV422DRAFT_509609 [Fimicolochytrium jonesii]KAI8816778.1 hypothetical protein EV422DRAFT_509609 [Fimicolochytrium jonesii]